MFGKREKPILVLITYDTAFITILNDRGKDAIKGGGRPAYAAAVYALGVETGHTDMGVYAQHPLICDEGMNSVIWFNEKRDLPMAIERIKEKFLDLSLPATVNEEIDFPFDRKRLNEAGSSIVEPIAPKCIQTVTG